MPLTVNSGEYRSVVGLDSLYIAEVTADTASGYTADTPEYLAPAAEASLEPAVNSETQYADDKPYDTVVIDAETKITLKVTGVPLEMLAKVTGREFDSTTGRMYDNSAVPPYMALMFRSLKSNGSYRYFCFLKGRFEMPSEEATTKGDTPDPKTVELVYTAIQTVYEFDLGDINASVKRVVGDTDTTNFSATGFFTQVQVPAVSAPSALALSSSVPTPDGATGVSVSANQTLTFNNALPASAIYNVSLITDSTGAVISAVNTLDTARKVMTINPGSSLGASTKYHLVYNVVDIYGQTLSGKLTFTTA